MLRSRRKPPEKLTAKDWVKDPDKCMRASLLYFNKHDYLSLNELMDGGLTIYGGPGAGKSSILRHIVLAALRLNVSVLGLCYKADEAMAFQDLAKMAGRDDVHVYDPLANPFNPLLDLQQRSGHSVGTREKLLSLIMSAINQLSESSSGESKVWAKITEVALSAAVTIFTLAEYDMTFRLIEEFLVSLPHSEAEAASKSWQKSNMIARAIRIAQSKDLTPAQRADLQRAARWVMQEAAAMSERTRQSIVVTASSGLSMLVRGEIGDALCQTENTWSPKEKLLDQPGVVIAACDVQTYGDMSKVILSQLKANIVDCMNTRDLTKSAHPVLIFADEWSQIITPDDLVLISTLRDKRSTLVAGTQGVNQLFTACSGFRQPEHAARTLMGLSGNKIFCSTTDGPTLDFAESVMSSSPNLNSSFGSSENDRQGKDASTGKSEGRSQQWSESIQPETPKYQVMRLARGGPNFGYKVEAFVTIAGKLFRGSGGKASIKVSFDQLRLPSQSLHHRTRVR